MQPLTEPPVSGPSPSLLCVSPLLGPLTPGSCLLARGLQAPRQMDAAEVSSPTALGLVPTAWPSLPSRWAAPHILPSTRLGWLSDPLASFTICSVRASICTLGALRYVGEGGVPESLPTGCYRGLPSPVNSDELLVSAVPEC